ncbi:MAG: lysoplasmalogenase [Sandaracinaceae bacterium]
MTIAFVVAMAVAVGILLFASKTERKWLERIAKPTAAAIFLAAALASGALGTAYGIALFVGLCFAALGDVLLLSEDKKMFLAGLVVFLIGHLGYAIAFAMRGVATSWMLLSVPALGVAIVPILRWLWPHVDAKMRLPVIAYVAVITSMVAFAVGTYGRAPDLRVLLGAIGFFLSDLAVARQRFVQKSFLNRAWGLPLYFFAQLALALSVA